MKENVVEFFKMFLTISILLDPLGNTPAFMALTEDYDQKSQVKILKQAMLIAGIVLMVFALGGSFILSFFGITPGAFYIAGGIIFFTIALEMIQSKPRSKHTPRTVVDNNEAATIAVFPLAFPLIAGPGTITTIMLYTANGPMEWVSLLLVVLATALGLFVDYWLLRGAAHLARSIGTTGLFVTEKIVGLILAGLSVQIIYDGLEKLGLLAFLG